MSGYKKFVIGGIFFSFLIISVFYISKQREKDHVNKILAGYKLSTGEVKEVKYLNKRGFKISFEYKYQEKLKMGFVQDDKYRYIKNYLTGKAFPVIISTGDSSVIDLLIFPEDFERYKIKFPDSLIWVKKFE